MFDKGSIPDASVDVIAIFHTLDHLADPLQLIQTCYDKLDSDGRLLIAVHNVRAISARLLKSRSPIFDIEHTYLFDKSTLKSALEKAGFKNVQVWSYKNYYSLAYLWHLLPMPTPLKLFVLNSIIGRLMEKIRFWIPLGNKIGRAHV